MASSQTPENRRIYGLRRSNESKHIEIPENSSCVVPTQEPPPQEPPFCHWDTQSTSIPMFPAFHYISRKLAERNLYIALIVVEYGQSIMPALPIPRSAQITLTKVVRKACLKFNVGLSWMTALGERSGKRSTKDFFDVNRFDPYLIHRSLIQHEVIFGGEGLTLLSIDHIYTFKHFLGVLSSVSWVPLSRVVCLASCIELFHRINTIYTGRKPLRGYFLRVYPDIKVNEATLDEVCTTYNLRHGASGTLGVSKEGEDGDHVIKENLLPDTESPTVVRKDTDSGITGVPIEYELPKFIVDIDSQTSSPWGSNTSSPEDRFPIVTYPRIRSVSDVPVCPLMTASTPYPRHRRDALCSKCRRNMASNHSSDFAKDTTTILGSEWESFRAVGLGLYTE